MFCIAASSAIEGGAAAQDASGPAIEAPGAADFPTVEDSPAEVERAPDRLQCDPFLEPGCRPPQIAAEAADDRGGVFGVPPQVGF